MTFTVMKFETFTGRPVYRILTNGCLADKVGETRLKKFSKLEAAQKYADKLNSENA